MEEVRILMKPLPDFDITSPADRNNSPSERVRSPEGPDRRETVVDRRVGKERRKIAAAEAKAPEGKERRVEQRRKETGLERRRGPGRRLSDCRRSAEEGEMTDEQFEFVMAIETYKKVNKRLYPTWTEVLEVIQQLGYKKVAARNIILENVPEPEICPVG
jgi:FMN phosphatase YigB (HAD superfamily)